MSTSTKGIKVTVEDLETGEKDTAEILNDYIIITAGTCEVANMQVHANGTHVITVKGAAQRRK